jgi:hypothetical protein
MSSTIFVIKPYKWKELWVFDDAAVNLIQKPFVGGTDRMIDRATVHVENADKGFLVVFSASYFPDAAIVLTWVREEDGGNVYRGSEAGIEGWLCPALLRYFATAPETLYVQVKAFGTR